MPDITYSCAFTGHRPHKLPWGYDESHPDCVAVKAALKSQIAALVSHNVLEFYSGMADGVDVWAAQAVLDIRSGTPGVRLHAVLPHPDQAGRWNRDARERYRAVLGQADETVTLADRYYGGCMQERNRYLVDRAAVLLTVYDGSPGGTAMTVGYARRRGRRIIAIDPVRRIIRNPVIPQI